MKIAIQGCAHGELEVIYDSLQFIEKEENIKFDLLICCGDFQASRNRQDLKCMAVSPKYYKLCSFYKYYSGEKKAPVLTIFIGGNHEASNYLQELPYGGWVAPNIYYLGYSGVVNVAGVRIAGISGIYKGPDYLKGRYEILPYNNNSIRSVYHIRQLDIFRLKQLTPTVDIFISHDWPSGICDFGDVSTLCKTKPFLKNDIESGKLGSKPCEELLNELKPSYWFSAHLHCKFAALIAHSNGKITKFLALDKCLPQRKYLQVLDIPHDSQERIELSYDLEWLTILHSTNHLLHIKCTTTFMPGPLSNERWRFTPTEEEKERVLSRFNGNLKIPNNFVKTGLFEEELTNDLSKQYPKVHINPQTTLLCEKLNISDPVILLRELGQQNLSINNMEKEQDMNHSDFIEFDSDSELENSQLAAASTPIKNNINSMILPDPINESVVSEESVVESSVEMSNDIDTSLANHLLINSNSSDNNVENVVECQASDSKMEDVEKNVDSPSAKKFKRRNANIYNTDNDNR